MCEVDFHRARSTHFAEKKKTKQTKTMRKYLPLLRRNGNFHFVRDRDNIRKSQLNRSFDCRQLYRIEIILSAHHERRLCRFMCIKYANMLCAKVIFVFANSVPFAYHYSESLLFFLFSRSTSEIQFAGYRGDKLSLLQTISHSGILRFSFETQFLKHAKSLYIEEKELEKTP